MLRKSFLMLCSSTRKTLIFTPFGTVFAKHIFCNNTIITMIMLYLYISLIPYLLLKLLFYIDGFTCSKKNMVLHPNNTNSAIAEYGALEKADIKSSPAKTRWQPARFFMKIWSADRICQTSYLSQEKIPYFLGKDLCRTTPGEILLSRESWHDIHTDMTQL